MRKLNPNVMEPQKEEKRNEREAVKKRVNKWMKNEVNFF